MSCTLTVDYSTKFTNQQFSMHLTYIYVIYNIYYQYCIHTLYIHYIHTHYIIYTVYIHYNIYMQTIVYILCTDTHYIIQRVHNCLCLGCCSTTPTSLSLDSNRNFQLLAAVTGRTVFFLVGRTGHSSPALG